MTTSTINYHTIAARISQPRFAPYLTVAGDLQSAINLYDWNIEVGAAFHQDIGRFEVVFRNVVDEALTRSASAKGWTGDWYRMSYLFSQHARNDIHGARQRATKRSRRPETHGKVIAELTFGFWRYLCAKHYLTSLWVPSLGAAFPHHPNASRFDLVREDVDNRMNGLHKLRNRIAHHEPIHQRNLLNDHKSLLDIAGWMCPDTNRWIKDASQTVSVINNKP